MDVTVSMCLVRTRFRYVWPGPRRVYMDIMRDMGVFARNSELNSVAALHWVDNTDWNTVRRRCSSKSSYWLAYIVNMTVWRNISSSSADTNEHRVAICRGSVISR